MRVLKVSFGPKVLLRSLFCSSLNLEARDFDQFRDVKFPKLDLKLRVDIEVNEFVKLEFQGCFDFDLDLLQVS